ncbi:MAG TPA: 4-hydroxybenzoate octaprenyltransferase, partial [Saliniramus sp.]|nr:4-hydroxybenzoate octaprenyltransferase [Saliniramus sp.]
GFYLATILLLAPALALIGAGVVAWIGLVAVAGHLAWQVVRIDPADGAGALKLFRSNRDAGLILFVGLSAAALLA